MTKKPIIGITLDFSAGGGFSTRPFFAIRTAYCEIIKKAGGIPICIPFEPELVDEYLAQIDGLLVPGGDFALDADWYISDEGPAFPVSPRLKFDIEIIKKALSRDIPLLGICAGMQILAGMHGAKLTSDIQKLSTTNLNHLDEIEAESYAHKVIVESDSLLGRIVKTNEFDVNSRHREGIAEPSAQITVSAKSPDGIIEAIEIPNKKFALGIQWHPEFFDNDKNFEIIKAFVSASQ